MPRGIISESYALNRAERRANCDTICDNDRRARAHNGCIIDWPGTPIIDAFTLERGFRIFFPPEGTIFASSNLVHGN